MHMTDIANTIIVSTFLTFITICNGFTISLTFSNGFITHLGAAQLLYTRELNATFYINSDRIAFENGFLNVFDINQLVELGFEIGGGSLHYPPVDLTQQDSPTILEQICKNRAQLIANGWTVNSFHYPFGMFNELTKQVVKECGFNSALVVENITSLVYAKDPYELPIYTVSETSTVQELISEARNSLGWTIFNFQNMSVEIDSHFIQFFDWLKTESDNGNYIVKSIDQVIGGISQPIPDEYANVSPTLTPDPDAFIKCIIGTGCLGFLVGLVLYVIITTHLKKTKKIKFAC